MSNYAQKAEAAREAVSIASTVCRSVQRKLDDVRAITKDDKSPVTVADFASQAIVAHILTQELGEIVMIGEEDAAFLRDPEHSAHLDATRDAAAEVWEDVNNESLLAAIDIGGGEPVSEGYWTLDPIDGTKGFLRGQQYAIALAFIQNGEPVVGAMACPNLPRSHGDPLDTADPDGCIYTAIKGEGCLGYVDGGASVVLREDHDGGPIRVCASVEKAHSNVSDTDRILEYMREKHGVEAGEPTRLDSQAKYAVVARGQADAYLRMPTRPGYVERIWDHAAGCCIACESGAFVTDIFGGNLDFSHGRGLEKNKGVVCAPPRVHGLLLEAIEALGIRPA